MNSLERTHIASQNKTSHTLTVTTPSHDITHPHHIKAIIHQHSAYQVIPSYPATLLFDL